MRRNVLTAVAVVALGVLGVAGCDDDTDEEPAPGGTEGPEGGTLLGPDGTQLGSGTTTP